ncbi:MAG: TonB family protein, partial [Saprospiraceae bacterium]
VYLLLTALCGLWLPFVPLSAWMPAMPLSREYIFVLPELVVGNASASPAFSWDNCLWGVYLIGVALSLLRLGWGLVIVLRRMNSTQMESLPGGMLLLRSATTQCPYSFFRCIVVPVDFDPTDDSGALMLSHEAAHVRERHSIDVLLFEMLCVACWFHPLAHWYRRSLRTLHEYTADAAVTRHFSKKQYGLLLIGQAHSGTAPALVHHFFHSPLKQRLIMLTQHASAPARRLKFALLLPLLLILASCLSGQLIEDDAEALRNDEKVHEMFDLEKPPQFPGGSTALMNYLAANIKYPEEARQKKLEGVVAVIFIINKDGSVSDIQIVKDIGSGCGAEAKRVIEAMPNWSPGESKGRPVYCRYTLPVRYKLAS